MGGFPPFARGRRWTKRESKARPQITHRVWFDQDDGYEYEKDPNPVRGTWHQIDWRQRRYRDIDPATGDPVAGSEGDWRPLR
jgi:hypothetical protein